MIFSRMRLCFGGSRDSLEDSKCGLHPLLLVTTTPIAFKSRETVQHLVPDSAIAAVPFA